MSNASAVVTVARPFDLVRELVPLEERNAWREIAAFESKIPAELDASWCVVADKVSFALGRLKEYPRAIALLARAWAVLPAARRASGLAWLHYAACMELVAKAPREPGAAELPQREALREGFRRWMAEALRVQPDSIKDLYRLGVWEAQVESQRDKAALAAFEGSIAAWRALDESTRARRHDFAKYYARALYAAARSALRLGLVQRARRRAGDAARGPRRGRARGPSPGGGVMSARWIDAARRLAEGAPEEVGALYDADAPEGDTARWRWFLLLVEAGDEPRACGALAGVTDEALRARGRGLLSGADEPLIAADADDALPSRIGEAGDADAATVELFLRWFGGRRDLYARQWWDERRRRGGYHPVEQPLTPAVARAHLDGRTTIGQYLLHTDGTCSFGVIDLDLGASTLAELRALDGDDVPARAHPVMNAYARRLLEAAARLGCPIFAEDSGGRGVHLWAFFAPRRPARAVRSLLAQVVAAAGAQPADVSVELFPKQDRLGPRGLSSLVKLPLGLHQATMRRCALLDGRLELIADPRGALSALRAVPSEVVDAVVGRQVVALPAPELGPAPAARPALPVVSSPRSLAEALRAIPPGAEEKAACERMLTGCAALAALVDRAYTRRRLEAAEARAVVYSLGLVGSAPALAEQVLATANCGSKELLRVRAGLPSPVGCATLRRLAPEAAAGCACPEKAVPYATPCLFAVGARAPSPPMHAPFAEALEGAPDPVQGPWSAVAESLGRIETRLEALERRDR
ncbi:MAG: hypothetical protein U0326_23930 [Polyangiales bacterium]